MLAGTGSRVVMRLVSDAMVAPPVVVDTATRIQEVAARMLDARADAALVVEDGRVCGLATAAHVAEALAQGYDVSETLVGVIARRDVPFIRGDEPLAEAHQRMRAEQCPIAPVVGSRRSPVGVLIDREAGA
jgi:predicted transcriptional regulator